jgi:hypothetical protein
MLVSLNRSDKYRKLCTVTQRLHFHQDTLDVKEQITLCVIFYKLTLSAVNLVDVNVILGMAFRGYERYIFRITINDEWDL